MVVGLIIGILLAALAYYICVLVGLPAVIAIIVAILVLLACIGGPFYHDRGRRVP